MYQQNYKQELNAKIKHVFNKENVQILDKYITIDTA